MEHDIGKSVLTRANFGDVSTAEIWKVLQSVRKHAATRIAAALNACAAGDGSASLLVGALPEIVGLLTNTADASAVTTAVSRLLEVLKDRPDVGEGLLLHLEWSAPFAIGICGHLLAEGKASPAAIIRYVQHANELSNSERLCILTDAVVRNSSDPHLWVERGKLLGRMGSLAAARNDTLYAHELASKDAPIASEAIWALRWNGEVERALDVARGAQALSPDDLVLAQHRLELETLCGDAGAILDAYNTIADLAGSTLEDHICAAAENLDRIRHSRAALRLLDLVAKAKRGISLPLQASRYALSSLRDIKTAVDPGELRSIESRLSPLPDVKDNITAELRGIADATIWLDTLPPDDRDLLFDAGFYRALTYVEEADFSDVALHYIVRGADRGLSPNPFFDPWFYKSSGPPLPKGAVAFHHYMTIGAAEGRRFHQDFDLDAYRAATGTDADHAPLLTTLRKKVVYGLPSRRGGRTRANSFSLWREAAAKTTSVNRQQYSVDALVRTVRCSADVAAMLPLLFDVDFYAEQLAVREITVPSSQMLSHYRELGWRLNLDPHPLFRTEYYCMHRLASRNHLDPLLDFVTTDLASRVDPHPLLANRSLQPDSISLLKYLETPISDRPRLSRFFDYQYYCESHPEIDWTITDPLIHYLGRGARRNWAPHPIFDPVFYTETAMSAEDRAVGLSPLEHFELSSEPRKRPLALFDLLYYARNSDLIRMCLVTHYVEHGFREGRRPNGLLSDGYIWATAADEPFAVREALREYLARKLNRRTRIAFVGHEASRTGAPAILLKLVEHFDKYENVECISINDQGGPLVTDFARSSHAYIMETSRYEYNSGRASKDIIFGELERIWSLFDDNPPIAVVCNSAEVRLLAEYFYGRGSPVLFLVHEIVNFYPPDHITYLLRNSDKVVLPAKFVAANLVKHVDVSEFDLVIHPQGLLRDSYGDRPAGDRERIYGDAGASVRDDHILVVGCGTIDGRKGFDLFVDVARRVKLSGTDLQIRFVWVGGRSNWRINEGAVHDSTSFWTSWEIFHHCDLAELVTVITEVADTEPFLVNADIFLMSSRADPFPCVVHEAMASRLPIICFADTTGAPEAFREDAGLVVPYRDTHAMADAVLCLAGDPKRRRKMGEAGRRRIKEEYRFSDYGEKILDEVLSLTNVTRSVIGPLPFRAPSRGRVVFTAPMWSLSGVNTFTETIVNGLNQMGFDAEILLTAGRFGTSQENGAGAVSRRPALPRARYRVLQPASLTEAEIQAEVRRELLAQMPCVFVPGFDYRVTDLAADLPPSISVLGVAHSDDKEHYDHCYRLGHAWDAIVAVSEEIGRKIRERNPVFADKLHVIPYGLPTPPEDVVEAAFSIKMLSARPIRLVYAGRFEKRQKRIFDYCVLAEQLDAAGVDYELKLIGDGTEFPAVARRLASQIAKGRVVLPGRLEYADTITLIRNAHILLVLSDFEGLPLSLIEALQNATIPVVYEMKSGIPNVVNDGGNGFIIPRGNVARVVRVVQDLQEDSVMLERIALNARRTPEQKSLNKDAMMASYIHIFERLLSNTNQNLFG